jgi:hypothetical protein
MKLSDHPLLNPHLRRALVLDSNLLLLHWCAQLNPSLIHTFKRLSSFQQEDADGLEAVLSLFPSVKTTPHVLTEVSNLANALPMWMKDDWSKSYSRQVPLLDEVHLPASHIVSADAIWLGLTDAALVELATNHVILTIDFPLSNFLESRRLNGINFTHLRSLWLT